MKKDRNGTTRRELMQLFGAGAVACTVGRTMADEVRPPIVIDPEPRFPLSPYLYMQFMEPLGTTDGSVAAAWDSLRDALAAGCDRRDEGAVAPAPALGRMLQFLLSLEGRRRPAFRAQGPC